VCAFTLVELTVALLISGMLASLVYASLFHLSQRQKQFTAANDRLLYLSGFHSVLAQDIRAATYVFKDGVGISCLTDSSSIYYVFNPAYVLRIREGEYVTAPDTFLFAAQDLQISLDGVGVNEERSLADALSFEVQHSERTYRFNFQKEYAIAQRMMWDNYKRDGGIRSK